MVTSWICCWTADDFFVEITTSSIPGQDVLVIGQSSIALSITEDQCEFCGILLSAFVVLALAGTARARHSGRSP
jgi:hypothetical protein